MCFEFLTEVLVEKPQVLVLCDQPSFVEVFRKSFVVPEFEVVVHDLSHPHSVAQLLTSQLDAAYRIIWFISQPKNYSHQLLQPLQPYQEKLLILLPMTTIIESDSSEEFKEWLAQTQAEQSLIDVLQHHLPHVHLLLGQDLILHFTEKDAKLTPPFEFMLSRLQKGVLLDPGCDLYPQSLIHFLANVTHHLTRPKAVAGIKGRKMHSSTFVKLLQLECSKTVGQAPTIHLLSATEAKNQALELETTAYPEPIELWVELLKPHLMRFKPPEPESPASANDPKSIVSPHGKPVYPVPHRVVASQYVTRPKTPSEPILEPVFKQTPPPVLTPPAPTEPQPVLELEVELRGLINKYRSETKVEQVVSTAKKLSVTKKKSVYRKKMFWLGLIMIGLATGVVSLVILTTFSSARIKASVMEVARAANQTNKIDAPATTRFWSLIISVEQSVLGTTSAAISDEARSMLAVSQNLIKVVQTQETITRRTTSLFMALTGRFPVDQAMLLQQLQTDQKLLQESTTQLETALKNAQSYQTTEEQNNWKGLETILKTKKDTLTTLTQIEPFLEDFIGLKGKRTYAIVFQNNQELRPLGGVVQAVGVVTLDQGLIIDTNVIDLSQDLLINSASATQSQSKTQTESIGQAKTAQVSLLPGEFAAPADIVKYLNTPIWSLKDATWKTDAPTATVDILKFLEQKTTKNIDGVIYLSTPVLADWIKVVGPVELPEFNEVITDKNLSDKLESHTNLQAIPGKSPEYVSQIVLRTLQKTTLLSQEKVPALLSSWYGQLENKQLLIVPRDQAQLNRLRTTGWTGSLLEPTCPPPFNQERCLVDVLAQSEANIGGNKANAYLDRSINHQIEVTSQGIYHQHAITFTNRGISNAWPRGTYKTYVRLYVPSTARLEDVTVNQQTLPKDQIVMSYENNRQVFGAVIDVPIQAKLTLQYDYFIPLSPAEPFSYLFFTQLQPGITPPKQTVSVKTPGFNPSMIGPQPSTTKGSIQFDLPQNLQNSIIIGF